MNKILSELVPINNRTRFWRGLNNPGAHPRQILVEADRALQQNSNDPQALHQKIACLIALKRYAEAAKLCEMVIEKGDNPSDVCNYAICLANLNKLDEALEMIELAKNSLEFANEKLGFEGIIFFDSSLLHFLDGDLETARKDYQAAKKLGYHDRFNPFSAEMTRYGKGYKNSQGNDAPKNSSNPSGCMIVLLLIMGLFLFTYPNP